MPALSKKQQKFMGIVRSIQKGEQPASKFSKDAQDVAKDMKKSSVKKFAGTKHKGLPSKVRKEYILNKLRKTIREELEDYRYGSGDIVKDVNPTCPHYGAMGKVKSVNPRSVVFVVMNKGKNFKPGMELEKSHDQMKKMNENKVYKVGDTVSLLSFDRRHRGRAKVKGVTKSRPNKFGIKNHYVTNKGTFTDMEVEGTEAFKLRFKGDTEKKVTKAMNSPYGVVLPEQSVNEKMRPAVKKLLKQKGYGPIFQAIDNSKRQFKQMKYSRGEIQDTLIGMFGSEDPKILQKIKESINESQPFADFTQFPKLSRAQQESLDELFGFAESYQIYNAFEKDPKKFIKTLDDMANIRKASNKKPKGVNFNKGKKQFVKEIANQEISALQNLEKGLDKLRKDYIKIMSIGDKTLKNKQYNDYYDYILNAKKGIGNLTQTLKRKQMLGEGRYHDWRNDESMTPKQKIGRSMREIRDALNELDKTVKMNLKLKTELKMKSEDYWKNTHKALTKISERLVKMANKVGNLK